MTENTAQNQALRISFEFFPPKSPDMEAQLWDTVERLAPLDPDFVSVTYGASGSTKEPTLTTVRRMIGETKLRTAAHLTCVEASRQEIETVVQNYRDAGVRRIVALRGDPSAGIGSSYVPHPEGFAQTADLVRALVEHGFDVSVSAYPEKHPESADLAADIEVLKRKAEAGAARALTQFFFDNDFFARYLEQVDKAGISIPVVPGIMPIQNLTQLKRFASRCGTTIPKALDDRFEGLHEDPAERMKVAADVAAEQIEGLARHGIRDFHIYTMNRAPLVSAVLERLDYQPGRAGAVQAA